MQHIPFPGRYWALRRALWNSSARKPQWWLYLLYSSIFYSEALTHVSCLSHNVAALWPLHPGILHLSLLPLSWLSGLAVAQSLCPLDAVWHWFSHPNLAYRRIADLLLTWLGGLTSDLPSRCGFVRQSVLLDEALVITRPALLAVFRCCRTAPLLVRTLPLSVLPTLSSCLPFLPKPAVPPLVC